jgi:hypothetical protein
MIVIELETVLDLLGKIVSEPIPYCYWMNCLFLAIPIQQCIMWYQNLEFSDFLLVLRNRPSILIISDFSLFVSLMQLLLQWELQEICLLIIVSLIQYIIDEL